MSLALIFLIVLIIGILIGVLLMHLARPHNVGTIVVDHSDPFDGPNLFLELKNQDWYATFLNSNEVMMHVEIRNYVSQK